MGGEGKSSLLISNSMGGGVSHHFTIQQRVWVGRGIHRFYHTIDSMRKES